MGKRFRQYDFRFLFTAVFISLSILLLDIVMVRQRASHLAQVNLDYSPIEGIDCILAGLTRDYSKRNRVLEGETLDGLRSSGFPVDDLTELDPNRSFRESVGFSSSQSLVFGRVNYNTPATKLAVAFRYKKSWHAEYLDLDRNTICNDRVIQFDLVVDENSHPALRCRR